MPRMFFLVCVPSHPSLQVQKNPLRDNQRIITIATIFIGCMCVARVYFQSLPMYTQGSTLSKISPAKMEPFFVTGILQSSLFQFSIFLYNLTFLKKPRRKIKCTVWQTMIFLNYVSKSCVPGPDVKMHFEPVDWLIPGQPRQRCSTHCQSDDGRLYSRSYLVVALLGACCCPQSILSLSSHPFFSLIIDTTNI